jgi:3-hydroxyisobutyrate dehydrogenase-like beta-hydroxyacid dehydrogenase
MADPRPSRWESALRSFDCLELVMKKIGMIGIGLMGHGIASNIIRRGYTLSVLEHPGNQPLDDLKRAGVLACRSSAALAADSEVVILCVTGSPQVETVVLAEDGLVKGMRSGMVVIDCSTALPSSTERVARAVQEAGGRFLDAPMTRTPKEAAQGRLNLLVGGDAELLNEMRPLLSAFAENITHVGPIGSGHRMKLLHNYVSLGSVALLAEAAACALRARIAPEVLIEILAKGGGAGTALERIRPYLLARDCSALNFAITNAQKDLSYYNSMAEQAGAVRGIGQAVLDTITRAAATGPDRLMPELVSILAERAQKP